MTEWTLYVLLKLSINGLLVFVLAAPAAPTVFKSKEECEAAAQRYAGEDTEVFCKARVKA